jgi:hypothetical protein
MGLFLLELQKKNEASHISPRAWEFHDGYLESTVEYEAAMCQYCNVFFDCETKEYARLSDLHGRSIPQTPFIISLAECWFKDELIEMWENM